MIKDARMLDEDEIQRLQQLSRVDAYEMYRCSDRGCRKLHVVLFCDGDAVAMFNVDIAVLETLINALDELTQSKQSH